jgi:hypothetical protein
MSLPGVIKHFRVLEGAQLVTTAKRGRTRECRLGPEHLDDATEWIEEYRSHLERRLDRLQAYIRKTEGRTHMSHDLTVERVFDAPPGVVFDAFTDPAA